MTTPWQLQEAKNRFSELVEKALTKGPQSVTRRGEEVVIVVSAKDYKKMMRPRSNLVDFFRKSPLVGVELNLERSRDLPREVTL